MRPIVGVECQVGDVSSDVLSFLSASAEYHLLDVVNEASNFCARGKRSRLSADDVNAALELRGTHVRRDWVNLVLSTFIWRCGCPCVFPVIGRSWGVWSVYWRNVEPASFYEILPDILFRQVLWWWWLLSLFGLVG